MALVIAAWIVGWLGAAGLAFAYFQGAFPTLAVRDKREDLGMALAIGLIGGPLALLLVFFTSGFAKHGWRLW